MNYSIIIYIIGMILEIEAVFMTLPAITALIYQETSGVAFLITIALCLVIGLPLTRKKPTRKAFYTKEGFVTVALSWIVLSIIGAIPFVISRSIPNPVDALFETVSGFTTTGASILSDVEALPHCMLMWRSFTHWIGGMGVLVFILSLLPLTGGYHMNLMKAESPGPSVSKLAPKVQSTAKILYSIYFVMTVIQILLLLVGGMPLFDSICTAFGTAGTGGFGIKNDSMASYSTYLQVVITVFMILFGVNFNAYFFIITKKFAQAFKMEEVRYYFGIIGIAILIIACNIYHIFGSADKAFQQAAFQVPIRVYEGNDLQVKNGKIYINGKEAKYYTFKMDYYWMQGDNRHNSLDSRYWGFVPEDHIVGKPIFIWWSHDPDHSGFSGIRWSRLFRFVDNIK